MKKETKQSDSWDFSVRIEKIIEPFFSTLGLLGVSIPLPPSPPVGGYRKEKCGGSGGGGGGTVLPGLIAVFLLTREQINKLVILLFVMDFYLFLFRVFFFSFPGTYVLFKCLVRFFLTSRPPFLYIIPGILRMEIT